MGDPPERSWLRDIIEGIQALFGARKKGTTPGQEDDAQPGGRDRAGDGRLVEGAGHRGMGQELLEEFKAELRVALELGGVTDATVQQIGSAVTGWEMDPDKPLKPWLPKDGAKYVVFSYHALVQVMQAHLTPDQNKTMGGEYLFFLDWGFYRYTPVGKRLQVLATQWKPRLGGRPVFRLALQENLLEDGVVILRQAEGDDQAMGSE